MIFITILKIIFTLLLCVPFVYIIVYFLMKLIDEVVKQNKDRQSEGTIKSRSRIR